MGGNEINIRFRQIILGLGLVSRENDRIPEVLPEKHSLPTILVVDENAAYIKTVRDSLAEFYNIIGADSADSALSVILAHGGGGIDAMLLSATLPGNDAARLLGSMRKVSGLWELPVIATIPDGSCLTPPLPDAGTVL